jgi:hypothetical protein
MSTPYVEPQIGKDKTGYWLTVAISHGDSRWVSKPARLASDDEAQAKAEASRQVTALLEAMSGGEDGQAS